MTLKQYKQTMKIYFKDDTEVTSKQITFNIQNREINEFYRIIKNPVVKEVEEKGDLELKLPSNIYF